jgi:DNA modification methylase
MPDTSVDCIVTSPPYPDARTVEQYGGASFDTTLAGYGRLGEAVFEALVPGGVCALNIDGPVRVWRPELGESERSLIAFDVAIDWARRVGFRYVEHCAYVRAGTPGRFGPRWRSGWEPVHVFARPGADARFDADGYLVPNASAGREDAPSRNRDGRRGWSKNNARTVRERGSIMTAWSFVAGSVEHEHPAPFPAAFADAYVLCYSQPDDLVCDPFVGSGTVAFSCHRHGRRFVGGDLGHRERDGRRWADIVNDGLRQTTLFDGLRGES